MRTYFRDLYEFEKKHWKKSLFFGVVAGLLQAYYDNSTRRV